MYYNMYEEYIRNVLGYPKRQDIYQNDISYGIEYGYRNGYQNLPINNIERMEQSRNENKELEKYYPEIYNIVYPIILEKCEENRGEINEQLINNITEEIYLKIPKEKREDRGDRQNFNLRDLIRILLLREWGRPNRPPDRPPFPPGGGRPPMGPGPGMPPPNRPPRPPMGPPPRPRYF